MFLIFQINDNYSKFQNVKLFVSKLLVVWRFSSNYVNELKLFGYSPFVATLLKGRFWVFFTLAFLLFLSSAICSNPAGPIA